MMALRTMCVIGAALVDHVSLWLALAFIVGGAVLPWSAVILANDRPPRNRARRLHRIARSDRELPAARSEEHTSELQSREKLVCRLLLEKKKKKKKKESKERKKKKKKKKKKQKTKK